MLLQALVPIMPDLAASQMVASLDMAPLAALNPQITHLLISTALLKLPTWNYCIHTLKHSLAYPLLDHRLI